MRSAPRRWAEAACADLISFLFGGLLTADLSIPSVHDASRYNYNTMTRGGATRVCCCLGAALIAVTDLLRVGPNSSSSSTSFVPLSPIQAGVPAVSQALWERSADIEDRTIVFTKNGARKDVLMCVRRAWCARTCTHTRTRTHT